MYDAIIVGARCAGSSTAMLLARQGRRVLLVDRAEFPSDTLSTHQLQITGGARLKRWGLLDEVIATGCPPASQVRFDAGQVVLKGNYPPLDGVGAAYSPRRYLLDNILLNAARAAGTEVRTRVIVEELLWDDEGKRVRGIRGRTPEGGKVEEEAKVVVGADGMRSLVAKGVQANAYNEQAAQTCAYYTYWEGVATTGGEIYVRGNRQFGMWPTNDGLVLIFLALPRGEFDSFRSNVEGNFIKAIGLVPELEERLRAGKRADRFYGTGETGGFFRKPYGPGWALVGDAGYHKDPITGLGMSDAFRDAELLADALHAGWSGREGLEKALSGYEEQRNRAALPMYEFTNQIASFAPPPPEQQMMFAALARNQAQCDRFFGVLTGSVLYGEFFSPGNLIRLLGLRGFARIALQRGGPRKQGTQKVALTR